MKTDTERINLLDLRLRLNGNEKRRSVKIISEWAYSVEDPLQIVMKYRSQGWVWRKTLREALDDAVRLETCP